MFLTILLVLCLIIYYCVCVKPYSYWKKKGVPTLKPLPLIGNLGSNVSGRKSFAELLEDYCSSFPNNRYVGFYRFIKPTLLICDPDLIKSMCVKDFDTFTDHLPMVPESVDPLWAKNVFAITGKDKWRHMRSTLSPMFTSTKMRIMFDVIKTHAKHFSQFYLAQNKDVVVVELKKAYERFANDVVTEIAFGITCNSLANPKNEFLHMGTEAVDFSGFNGLRLYIPSIAPNLSRILRVGMFNQKVSRFFRSVIKNVVSSRVLGNITRPDMIHQLIESQRNSATTYRINNDDITAQALLYYFAGVDTISSALSFSLYELALNLDVQAKLRVEVDSAIQNCDGDLTYDALSQMEYLEMVVNEALRKWPPNIATDRICTAPFTLAPTKQEEKPLHIDVGTHCMIPIYAIHRSPQYYPNPEKFDPERFSNQNKGNLNSSAFLPFGVGPRNCIAMRFALIECRLMVAEIISKFEVITVPQTENPLTLNKIAFNLQVNSGIWVGFKPRISASRGRK